MSGEKEEDTMVQVLVKDKEFKISGVTAGDLLRAMRDAGPADDVPTVACWADMLACALRRRGVPVQLTIL